jgi:hypothetical protein
LHIFAPDSVSKLLRDEIAQQRALLKLGKDDVAILVSVYIQINMPGADVPKDKLNSIHRDCFSIRPGDLMERLQQEGRPNEHVVDEKKRSTSVNVILSEDYDQTRTHARVVFELSFAVVKDGKYSVVTRPVTMTHQKDWIWHKEK